MESSKNAPYLIGVTGSFGAGKSLVGDILKKLDIFVVDSDELVANILSKKNNATDKVVQEFGDGIVSNDQYFIDKKKLAKIIFASNEKRKKLELIIHPEVNKMINQLISQNIGKSIIAVLIPLLFESKLEDTYDESWCVICKDDVRFSRLQKRGYSKEDAIVRIKAQFSQEEKSKYADFTIDNSNSIDETKNQIIQRLKQMAELSHNLRLSYDK